MKRAVLSALIAGLSAFSVSASAFLDSIESDVRRVLSSPYATGGDYILKVSEREYIHVFCTPETEMSFVPSQKLIAQVLVVGGGGGGGSYNAAGGGGGGGYVEQDMEFVSGESYSVIVGAGGAAGVQGAYDGANGGDTKLGAVVAYGGGGGGGNNHPGKDGASSGGGNAEGSGGKDPGALSAEGQQGNLGAKGVSNRVGGGGGGAGAAALVGDAMTPSDGGDGRANYILGYRQYFAGGGGGGMHYRPDQTDGYNGVLTHGGLGGGAGGGFGFIPDPAEDGLGGGGGGGDKGKANGGSRGGSGIVVIRYYCPPESGSLAIYSGGTVSGGVLVRVVNAPGEGIDLVCRYGYAPGDLTAGTVDANNVRSDYTFNISPLAGCPMYFSVTSSALPDTELRFSEVATPILRDSTTRVVGSGATFKYTVLATPPSSPAEHEFQLWMGPTMEELTLRKSWSGSGLSVGGQTVSGGATEEESGKMVFWYIRSVTRVGGYEFVEETSAATDMLVDDVVYTWNPEVTSGSWSDSASWIKPFGALGAVPTSGSSASFDECLPETPYEIVIDEDVTASSVYSRKAKQQLKFVSTSGKKFTTNIDLIQANSTNTFDGVVFDASSTPKRGNGFGVDGYVIILTNGTSATFTEFYTKNKGVVLYVGKDCTAVINNSGQEGGTKTIIVDDGTLIHAGFAGQNNGSATIDYVVKGKKGQVKFKLGELYLNATWKRVRFSFEIPDGGYDQVPVVFDETGKDDMFLKSGSDGKNVNDIKGSNFCKGESDTGLIFEVLPTSPILFSGADKAGSHDLFVWSKTGFAYYADSSKGYDMHDYTTLVVPRKRSDGRDVKSFAMSIRGLDEVSYPDAKSLRAAGTVAYAVSYESGRAPGFNVFIR